MPPPTPLDDIALQIDPTGQAVLAVLLAFIMFSVALGLSVDSFRQVARRPAAVLGGLGLQILVLPALTFVAAWLIAPTASVALGMMVVAACPGGSVSNLFTLTARGDTALSVSLTALSSVVAAVTTPLNIVLWASLNPQTAVLMRGIGLDRAAFLAQTALILAAPLAAGMLLAARAPGLARRLRKPCHTVAFAALLLFAAGAVVSNRAHLGRFGAVVLPVVIGHNALAFLVGYLGARSLGLAAAGRRALTFEIGIQNAGLGLVILLGQFRGLGGAALVTAGWGAWHLIAGALLAGLWARRPLPAPVIAAAAAAVAGPEAAGAPADATYDTTTAQGSAHAARSGGEP